MDYAYEYVYQVIDICVAELVNQHTGINGTLTDRQKWFLYNIITRFKSINQIGLSWIVGHNAYTIGKAHIYFRPTNIQNIN